MRSRVIAAFFLGFATGLVVLGVGLWLSGSLRVAPPHALQSADLRLSQGKPPAPLATPTDEPERGAPPRPGQPSQAVVPPQSRPEPQEASILHPAPQLPSPPPVEAPRAIPQGQADRVIPDLAKPHLQMPIASVDPNTLTDTFNQTRDGTRPHEALDISAPRGTPVHAVADGNVAKLFTSKQGGLTVYQFNNSRTRCYYYAHLDHYAPGLKEGTLLRAGDVLGYVGTTGNAPPDTPHLHFAVFELGPEQHWWQGKGIDPLPLLK